MRLVHFLLIGLLAAGSAWAQVQPSGTFTPGHTARILNPGGTSIGDAGGSAGSALPGQDYLTELGITNTGTPLCINDALTNAPGGYHAFCLGANALGGGIISYQALGGAAQQPLIFNVNGVNIPLVPGSVTGLPEAVDNAALQALASTFATAVLRLDYSTGNGAPPLVYRASNSACSLNAGAGDNGSQVRSVDGKCWLAAFSSAGADAREWGAVGDGSTADDVPLQNAINAVALVNIPLLIVDGRYKTSTGLTSSAIVTIEGVNGTADPYQHSCTNGLVTNSDITMLRVSGLTATVRNLCIEMAPTAGTRLSGAGILVGGTSSTQQGHAQIIGNTVINGYDGIILGGGTTGPTQSNGDVIMRNLIISASHFSIGIGIGNSGGSAPATVVSHNQVVCFAAQSAAVGIEVEDGALTIENGDEGPFGCNIGTEFRPGAGQVVGATSVSGVVGDSSITHDLFISPTDVTAFIYDLTFAGSWTGSVFVTDQSVLVENLVGSPMNDIKFVGHTFYGNGGGGGGSASPLVKLNTFGITVTGSQLIATGYTLATGIEIGASANNITLSGNSIYGSGGTITNGIKIDNGAQIFNITGNTIIATNSFSYTPAGETAVIVNNLGDDNVCPMVASGTTIAVPNAATCIDVTGSTPITDITNSIWSDRRVILRSQDGVALNTGGSAGTQFCIATTVSAVQSVQLYYDGAGGCWSRL